MSSGIDLFEQINNAVLDLQGSHHHSYNDALGRLGRLLDHPDLAVANAKLTDSLDLEQFLSKSGSTRRGAIGSGRLSWPSDPEQYLGMRLLLMRKLASDPDFTFLFSFH